MYFSKVSSVKIGKEMSAPYLWRNKCAATGCNSKGKKIRLFRFPQSNGPTGKCRVQKWLDCAQNPKVNTTHAYLCDLHFNNRQFRDADRTLLIYGAVPTIRVENGVYVETSDHHPEDNSLQPAEVSSLHYPEEASVQNSEDDFVQNLDDATIQNPEYTSVQHSEEASVVQHPEHFSVRHYDDAYIQYSVDTSLYNEESTSAQDILAEFVHIPPDDNTSVQICSRETANTVQIETAPSAVDEFDHLYAKHIEPCTEKDKVPADHNNHSNVKKASFTVYVITPKSEGMSAVTSPPRKMKSKCSVRLSTSSEQSCGSDSFLQSAEFNDSGGESCSITSVYHSVPHETSTLLDFHSRTSCRLPTSREKKLIVAVSKRVRSLRQIKNKYEKQTISLKSLCSTNSEPVKELDQFSKSMSLASANFLASRVFCRKKLPKSRKWSREDLVHALSLYKKLPKCYTLLTTIFALPSKMLLSNILTKIIVLPGLNTHIFDSLQKTVSGMDAVDRACLLLFDEIPLEEHLQYDSRTDAIIGFEDWGHLGKRDKIGSHALVFMLKGLNRKWKQPVVFYFTAGTLSMELLRSVLQACWRAGFNVVATVCNMNVNNAKLLKRLGASEEKPFLLLGGNLVVTLYNPPQLFMCLRDMLFKNDVFVKQDLGGKTAESKASWSVIRKAYNIDCKRKPFRFLHKLTDDHLEPIGEAAETVALAAQVLSHTMAATICCFTSGGLLDSSALATAQFVGFCNKLFDSMNGRTVRPQGAAGLQCQLRKERENLHLHFWSESISELKQWKIMRSYDKSNSKQSEFSSPSCVSGWITTLRGMKLLWTKLKDIGFTHVEPRSINLELIEHLFASVQSNSSWRPNPTASQFISSLKTLMVNGLACVSVEESDCEERCDTFELLCGFRDLVAPSSSSVSLNLHKICDWTKREFSVAHITDYIVKKIDDGNNCDNCKQALLATTPDEYIRCAVIFKAYSDKCPSEKLLWCVAHASRVLEAVLPKVAHRDLVQSRVVSIMKERVNFDWLQKACSLHTEHIQDEVLTAVCCAMIPQWCRGKAHQLSNCVEVQLQICKIIPEHR